MRARALTADSPSSAVVGRLRARGIVRFPARRAPRHRPQRPVRLDDGAHRQRQLAPPGDVGHVAEGADHGDAGPLLRVGQRVRHDGHARAEERRDHLAPEERLVARVVGVRDERHAGRQQLGPRRVDLDEGRPARRRRRPREPHAVVGALALAVLELRLRDRGAEVHVPQRGRLELVRLAAPEQAQEGELREALRAAADRRVGCRPVDRQAQIPPQVLERLLVLGRQPVAQLDEVRARDRDRWLGRLGRRRERRVVRQRGVAAHAVVVLHAALGRQAVVVPAHRVEDRLAAHALEARHDVGVRVGEHVADVERPAHRRRRRVDRVDLRARARAVEPVEAVGLPPVAPFHLEPFERGFLRYGNRPGKSRDVWHNRQS